MAIADIGMPIPWNIEPSQPEPDRTSGGRRNRDSGSFAGSSGDLGMNLGRCPGNYLRVRKNHPGSWETVLFGHRSPPNLNDENVDWLAALVGREYNAAHSDRSRHRAFYLSDC
jgi:hypothetical protein